MSIELTKGSTSAPQDNPTPNKKKSTVKDVLTVALILSLLGTWGYIIWDKNKTREIIQEKDSTISSTSAQRDELQKELADATIRFDVIKTSNAKKDSAITAKDKEIQNKQVRIRQLLSKINATQTELTEAKNLIADLNNDIEGYKKQIAVLEGKNTVLTEENKDLSHQRDKLKKDYDSSVEKIKDRENTINIGSTLHVSNFNIAGLNIKNNGSVKETSNAKKVDKLRVSFDLDENMITPSGMKELFIIITDPEGKVAAQADQGSGKFATREGEVKQYTQQLNINYTQNKRQTVSFDWKGSSKYSIGTYKIEVYNNGFKVGEAMRPLKKGGIFG